MQRRRPAGGTHAHAHSPDAVEVADGAHVVGQRFGLGPLEVLLRHRDDVTAALQRRHNLLHTRAGQT